MILMRTSTRWCTRYGIDKVRGGTYSKPILTLEMERAIKSQLYGASDACFECGSNQHWVKECPRRMHEQKPTIWFTAKNGQRGYTKKLPANTPVDALNVVSVIQDVPVDVPVGVPVDVPVVNNYSAHTQSDPALVKLTSATTTIQSQPPHIRACLSIAILCCLGVIMFVGAITAPKQ